MIAESLPPDLGQFVEQQVAAGRYQSEQDLVTDAVRVLRELETRQERLREDVRQGMEQLEQGEFCEYDLDELRQLFDGLKERARNSREAPREEP
jgi:putative addiction module CopG family antidote